MTVPEPSEAVAEPTEQPQPGLDTHTPEPTVKQLPHDDPMSIQLEAAIEHRRALQTLVVALVKTANYAADMWEINAETPPEQRQARNQLRAACLRLGNARHEGPVT